MIFSNNLSETISHPSRKEVPDGLYTAHIQILYNSIEKFPQVLQIGASHNGPTEAVPPGGVRRGASLPLSERYPENHVMYGDIGAFQRDQLMTDYFQAPIRPKSIRATCVQVDELDSILMDQAGKTLFITHPVEELNKVGSVDGHARGPAKQFERGRQGS